MVNINPNISIIFPSYNGEDFLKRNLDSIISLESKKDIELVIVDNDSTDNTLKIIESYNNKLEINLIKKNTNLGYAKACNLGVLRCNGEFIFLTNQDVIFTKEFFKKLRKLYKKHSKHKDLIISPAMVFENNSIHYYGAKIHFLGFSYTPTLGKTLPKDPQILKTSRFSGGSVFMKRDLFLNLGKFDESFFMYYEDTDMSLRCLRKKILILTTNDPFIIHQKHDWSFSDFRYYLLERNRFLTYIKNINSFHKICPVFIINEMIMIFHAIISKKFSLRIRIYYELWENRKKLLRIRKQAGLKIPLISYNKLSRNLDTMLIRSGKIDNILKMFLKLFNILLKLI